MIIKLSRLYDDGTMMMTIAITVVKSITNYLLLHSFCIEHSVQIQNQIHQCCFTGFLPKICIIRNDASFWGNAHIIAFCLKCLPRRNDSCHDFFLIIKVRFTSPKHTTLAILKYSIQWILVYSKCTTLTTI